MKLFLAFVAGVSAAEYYHQTVGTGSDAGYCGRFEPNCPSPYLDYTGKTGGLCAQSKIGDYGAISDAKRRTLMYNWALASAQSDDAGKSYFTIPTGLDWNKWDKSAGFANDCITPTCSAYGSGATKSCADAFNKVSLVHDVGGTNCWDPTEGIPVWGTSATTDSEMTKCKNAVKHLLGKRVPGNYFFDPLERVKVASHIRAIFVCDDQYEVPQAMQKPDRTYYYAKAGFARSPWAFANRNDMCEQLPDPTPNKRADSQFGTGSNRYQGSIVTESFGGLIFDAIIPYVDPQGWRAAQKVALQGIKNNILPVTGWTGENGALDCYAVSRLYMMSVTELLLYNTRVSSYAPQHAQVPTADPDAYCLFRRWYEKGNTWTDCGSSFSGTRANAVVPAPNCTARLLALGVTTFPVGWTDSGGGAKTSAAASSGSSLASCTAANKTAMSFTASNNPWAGIELAASIPDASTLECVRKFSAAGSVQAGAVTLVLVSLGALANFF